MDKQPNVIIIMTDQQRADLCAKEGYPLDTTPFLDTLARNGTWFNRAYCSMPICVPSRTSMHTGRFPSAHGIVSNHHWSHPPRCEKDLFSVFRENGYKTALFGKNHSHLPESKADGWYVGSHMGIKNDTLTEAEKQFNEYLKSTHFQFHAQPAPFPAEMQLPCRFVKRACQWIEEVAEDPFLLWLSIPEPHNPYQLPHPYYNMFPPEDLPPTRCDDAARKGERFAACRKNLEAAFPDFAEQLPRARSNYLGMLRLIDDQISRLCDFLHESKLFDNTILLFLSDHGDFAGEYGLMRKGPDTPECLCRIPMQWHGPDILPRNEPLEAHVSIVDILPTLCDAIGANTPTGVQGRSLWPMLTTDTRPDDCFASAYVEHGFGGRRHTQEEAATDECIAPSPDGIQYGRYDCLNNFTASGVMRMVRKDRWKLCWDPDTGSELYDLIEDPAELTNRSDDPQLQNIRCELMEELLNWCLRLQDTWPPATRRHVVKR